MPRTVKFDGTTHQFPDDATDAEVSSALESAHPAPALVRGTERLAGGVAPGVEKPALPSALQPDKPEFTGDSYGSELPIPSSNFATDGITQVGRGITKIGAGPYSAIEQKNGVADGSRVSRGISDVIRGGAKVASPIAAGMAVAAPATAIGGAVLGAGGEGIGRAGAALMGGDEDQQSAAGDVLGMAGAHYGGKAGDVIRGAAPRYLNNRALQDATVDMIPYFGGKLNKLRNVIEGIPSAPNGPLPADHPSRFRTPIWGGIRGAQPMASPEPGSKIGQNPFSHPLDPVESLPSGREVGGAHNIPQPVVRPERPAPLWKQYGSGPIIDEPVNFQPITSDLPSGRFPVSSRFPEAPSAPREPRTALWHGRDIAPQADTPEFTPIRGASLPSGRQPGGAHNISSGPVSRAPISDPGLLDGIARGQSGKRFAALSPEEQLTVRRIAGAVVSPAEQSLPGGQAVIRSATPAVAEPADMTDILQRSIDRVRASGNGKASIVQPPSGMPLKVRRR